MISIWTHEFKHIWSVWMHCNYYSFWTQTWQLRIIIQSTNHGCLYHLLYMSTWCFLRISWNNSYNSSISLFKIKIQKQCVWGWALIFLKCKMKELHISGYKSSFFLFISLFWWYNINFKACINLTPNQIIYNLALNNFFKLKNHALKMHPYTSPHFSGF